MGGQRTHRLLFVALTVVLAGFLAIPAKLSPSPDRTRVTAATGPSTLPAHVGAGAAPVPRPLPRREHSIQEPTVDDT
ncbi:MAG: hypothetical protein QOH79_1465, partial [Acidimicrobiaceae bacterium]